MHWTIKILCSKKVYTGYAKCLFGQTQVENLSYIVGGGVIAVDPAKTHTIMDWPERTCVKHI